MGPTQSTVAWPGCSEEGRDHRDSFPNSTQQGADPKPTVPGRPETDHHHQHHQQQQLRHQHRLLAAQATAGYPPDPEDLDDSHHVSVNPVYEFALCRKIKETLSKGPDLTSCESLGGGGGGGGGGGSRGNSQTDLQDRPSSVEKVEVKEEEVENEEDDVWSTSVVSVQPQSLTTITTPAVNVHEMSSSASAAKILDEAENEPETESVLLNSGQNDEEKNHHHHDPSSTEPSTKHATDPTDITTTSSDDSSLPTSQDHKEEDSVHEKVPTTRDNSTLTTTTSPPPSPPPNPQPASSPPVPTECRGTQTTSSPPANFTLAPPPPRPVMISVSTPPDETSPGNFLTKLSQQPSPTDSLLYNSNRYSYLLADDVASLSSPDFESDASDAGYVHLRGRFGSGGATAAGAAASAPGSETCEVSSTPETGRRKRSKKKEEKSIEYVLRQLHSLASPQEKLSAMCKKYTDLYEDQKANTSLLKQHQRKMNVVLREKDQLQSEHNQVVMKKCKLETLCRELQKQNKAVKDESLLRAKEEDEKRREMSAKFKTSIADIQQKVNDNHAQNVRLQEENQALTRRLQTLVERHQERDEELDRVTSTHRDLELRLAHTRLQQASDTLREEQETHLKEKEKILLQATEGKKKNALLEAELSRYKERYEEFQDTIDKSGQTFNKLKSDIDRMGHRIKKLEKEGEHWKHKCHTSSQALEQSTLEKSKYEKENNTLQTKVTKLESLCRALQAQIRQASKTTAVSTDPCSETASSSSSSEATSTTTSITATPSGFSPDSAVCVSGAASEPVTGVI